MLVVAAALCPPSVWCHKEGNENNLNSVTLQDICLQKDDKWIIKKNSIYLYYFVVAFFCLFFHFSVALGWKVLISSVTTSCLVYLAVFLAAKVTRLRINV